MAAIDAAHDPVVRSRFITMLDGSEDPAWFKASEIAQTLTDQELWNLGYVSWEGAVPAIKELAFDMRAMGYCEIKKGGKTIPEDVTAFEVKGGIQIRRMAEV